MSDEVAVQEPPVEQQTAEEEEIVAQDTDTQEPEQTEEKTEPEAKESVKKENHDDRRWQRLLRERAEYKAKADFLESLRAQQAAPAQPEGRPSRAAYDSDEDYVDALTTWKVDQKLAGVQDKISQTQTHAQVQQTWATKVTEARSTYVDYDTVMEDAQDIPINQHVAEAIQTSDVGADVAYYLGKHPEEAERINGMAPLAAARAIGRIESKIEDVRAKQPKASASKAPDPIKPVKPTGTGSKRSLEEMSMEEYYAHRIKQSKNRR